jgi:bile acid-coenzyme A ligase
MDAPEPSEIAIGERIDRLAATHPEAVAVVSVAKDGEESTLSWAELARLSTAAAHQLPGLGVEPDSTVAIALPPGIDHVIATIAAWKLGTLVVPIDPKATTAERAAIATALGPHSLIGDDERATIRTGWWREARPAARSFRAGTPRSASLTGGTTGTPRAIVRPKPWTMRTDAVLAPYEHAWGMRLGQVQLVILPLYHTGFSALYRGLALDHRIVLMDRFAPSLFLRLVERHRVQHIRMVAPVLRMVLEAADLADRDLSSIQSVHHGAGPCPEQVKRRWLELLGPERLFEVYSNQERIGRTVIRGDDWLRHPGSVGRPVDQAELRILDEHGQQLATGEIGEVYVAAAAPTFLGDTPAVAEVCGFRSVGDLGYLDDEGYLYLVDRKSNVLNVGGQNVYPAEVEAVLLDLPEVADAVVTGKPHDYLGQSVHALVVPADPVDPVTTEQLDAHCRVRLSRAKVPMSYELVARVPRAETGKVRRFTL